MKIANRILGIAVLAAVAWPLSSVQAITATPTPTPSSISGSGTSSVVTAPLTLRATRVSSALIHPKPGPTLPPPFKCSATNHTDCQSAIDATGCMSGGLPCTSLNQVPGAGHDPNACGTGVTCSTKKLQGASQGLLDISSYLTTSVGGGGLMDCPSSGGFNSKPELFGLVLTGLNFIAWSKTGDFSSPQIQKLSTASLGQFAIAIMNQWVYGTAPSDPCSQAAYFSTTSVPIPGMGSPLSRAISVRVCAGMGLSSGYYNPEDPTNLGHGFDTSKPINVSGILGLACCYMAADHPNDTWFDPRSLNPAPNGSTCGTAIQNANFPPLT